MKTRTLLLIGIAVLGAITAYYLFFRRRSYGVTSTGNVCVNVPPHFETYDQNIDWGDFASQIKQAIGNYDQNEPYVHGFLKGLNVKPKGAYVKFYSSEIREHLKQAKKLPHWEVNAGMYRCDNQGALPYSLN